MRIITTLIIVLFTNFIQADQIKDLKTESIEAVNFVANCPEYFQGKIIVSAVKGTYMQGIVMTFFTNKKEAIRIKWDARSDLFSCENLSN
jgi:hypothetical protein